VIENVRANCGVNAGSECDFQLGAYAIGARDEHRLPPSLSVQLKEGAESADRRKHAPAKRLPGHGGNPPLRFVSYRNIHAGVGVAHEGNPSFEAGAAIGS